MYSENIDFIIKKTWILIAFRESLEKSSNLYFSQFVSGALYPWLESNSILHFVVVLEALSPRRN